jgi:hypothetical protein
MYTIDNELNLVSEPNYKWPFWMLFILFVCFALYVYNKAPELRVEYIDKTDTIILNSEPMPLTDSAITHELTKLGCVLPNVALAQFKIETGHYTSAICKENKNLAGIRNSNSPLSRGKNRGHNVYDTYRDCLKDYVRIQERYLSAIDGKYAESKGYLNNLRQVR